MEESGELPEVFSVEQKTETFIEKKIGDGIVIYGFPILIVFGTVSNIISLIVLRCKSFRTTSISVSFSILSIVFLCILYLPMTRSWLRLVFDVEVRTHSSFGCKLHVFLTYLATHLCSSTMAFIVMQRALAICFPLSLRSFFSSKNFFKAWLILFVIIFTLNFHFFFTFDCEPDVTQFNAKELSESQKNFKKTFDNLFSAIQLIEIISKKNITKFELVKEYEMECYAKLPYIGFFNGYWHWIDIFVSVIIPFTVILIGNIAIVFVINRIKIEKSSFTTRKKLFRQGSELGIKKGVPTSSTYMLICSSLIFLLLNLPLAIVLIYNNLSPINPDPQTVARGWLAFCVTNFLSYLCNSIMFFVYYVSGNKFRGSFKECFSTVGSRFTTMSTNLSTNPNLQQRTSKL